VRVAFVGSHSLDVSIVAGHLLKTLVSLPPETVVLLRKGRTTVPGDFETLTQALCLQLHIDFEWCIPDEGGREAVFLRDIEMVTRADAVVAYFDADSVMQGGTGHVVDKAMDIDRPVYAYAPQDGTVKWAGGHEPATTASALARALGGHA